MLHSRKKTTEWASQAREISVRNYQRVRGRDLLYVLAYKPLFWESNLQLQDCIWYVWRGILRALLSYADSADETCLSSLAGLKGYRYKGDLWLCIIFSFQPMQTLSISKLKPKVLAMTTRGVLYIYTFVVSNRINASLYGCRKCINTILLSVLDLWGSVPLLDSRWSWDIQMLGSRHGAEHTLDVVRC